MDVTYLVKKKKKKEEEKTHTIYEWSESTIVMF